MLYPDRRFVTIGAMILFFGGTTTCYKGVDDVKQGESPVAGMAIEEALKQHTDQLMNLPGVVGVAIGESEGKPCIKVLIVQKTPELANKIPSNLEGFPVVVEETGTIRALDRG
jgi:hypothetical protein